jgi:hypothetical protein
LAQTQVGGSIGAGEPRAVEFFALLWGDQMLQFFAGRRQPADAASQGTKGGQGGRQISQTLPAAAPLLAKNT